MLLNAAAGGVGSLAAQWLRHLGAKVIGTVGSAAKARLAAQHGCCAVFNYREDGWAERVREHTGGEGVAVVYDGIGRDTFEGSLDCLRPRGTMVTFGNASGPVPPMAPLLLAQKGSLFLTRPVLAAYTSTREDLLLSASRVLHAAETGILRPQLGHRYTLQQAAQAHQDLEGRRTTGALLLLPEALAQTTDPGS